MTKAVLYVPPKFAVFAEVSDQLNAYCAWRGYSVVGVDQDGKPWWDSLERAHRMGVERIVAAEWWHLPDDWGPRVEVAKLPFPGRRRPRNSGGKD